MLELLRRRSPCLGSALFRGTIPHRLEQLDGLARPGLSVEPGPVRDGTHWTATLTHPEWGIAEAVCLRDPPAPDRRLLELDPRLSGQTVEELLACGVSISISMPGEREFVLRDRKNMLRFLDALLGADGVAAVDHTSQAFWTRPALEDELAHDADLDVESLYTIHAVTEEDGVVSWLHTHGLGEIGRFDFDILRPDRSFVDHGSDFCRAMAFAIFEGTARPGVTAFEIGRPFRPLHLVTARDFMRLAATEDASLREDPSGIHLANRVVLCEPPRGSSIGRLFGRRRPRPNRVFAQPLADNLLLDFSAGATRLMADRARKTYPVLRAIAEEVADLELPILVKIGHVVDGGRQDQREHLWFKVHELADEWVDATLVNSPYWIERLREGDRGTHSLDGLSDWIVLTPFGPINPHAFHARRLIRDHRNELLGSIEDEP